MNVKDSVRTGDAKEAADWVAYCNDPASRERQAHGHAAPLGIRYWQLGNETSYDKHGFDLETAARKTVEFAKAMRAADPSIQVIAWGDSGWAGRMAERAGEHAHTSRSITCSIPTPASGRCCAASCTAATRTRPGIS